jgi:hypothetical protein
MVDQATVDQAMIDQAVHNIVTREAPCMSHVDACEGLVVPECHFPGIKTEPRNPTESHDGSKTYMISSSLR